jgi:hypothetical protein
MLNLTRAIDRATGYVFLPPTTAGAPPGTAPVAADAPASAHPNAYALLSTAAGPLHGTRSDVRDVQERWVDARGEWDAFERREWRREGEIVREEAEKAKRSIRERS